MPAMVVVANANRQKKDGERGCGAVARLFFPFPLCLRLESVKIIMRNLREADAGVLKV